MRGLIAVANQQPELSGVFSTFTTDTPQIYLNIDRDKAQTLGILPSDIFQALQATLGGYYVNDFNLFGRTWQVVIQGEAVGPQRHRGHLPDQRAQRLGRHGADPRACGAQKSASARPYVIRYNNVPGRDDQRQPGPRPILRRSHRRHGAHLRDHAARRLWLRVVRHRASGEGGRRPDRHHSRPRGLVRLPVPGRPVRELLNPRRASSCR